MEVSEAKALSKIVHNQINNEDILTRCVSNPIVTSTEETIPAALSAYLTQVKDKLKTEVMRDTKTYMTRLSEELTETMVRASYKSDKRELFDRRLNLTLTGVEEDSREKKNPAITAEKIIAELSDIGCCIKKEDLSSYHRLYRANSYPPPRIIKTRFISQQVCDHVMGYRLRFNSPELGKYINREMSHLLRRLFTYLRTRDDILIKKSVSFKDGHIIYLLKRNESDRRWSRANTIFDLEMDFNINLVDETLLTFLGLENCIVKINLD